MEQITTVGIDLAKSVVSVHGVDARGNTVLRKTLSAARLMEFMARLPPCRVGLEACSGAHAVARGLQALGHDARIMAPKFVVPYRKNQKNDGNDAEAICEAVGRPKMRFVPVKSAEQQAVLLVHRVRAELVAARSGLINQVRGLLAEFGLVMPKGRFTFRHQVAAVLDDARVPTLARAILQEVVARIRALDEDILAYDRRIDAQVRDSEPMQRIGELCGVDHRQRDRGQRRRREAVQERPSVCRLAGLGAAAVLHRRQANPGAHHQARRCVPAHAAGPRGALGADHAGAPQRSAGALGGRTRRAARLQARLCGDGRQERARDLGPAGTRRGVAARADGGHGMTAGPPID